MLDMGDVGMMTVFTRDEESGHEGAVFCHMDGRPLTKDELAEMWNYAVVGAAALGKVTKTPLLESPKVIDL